MTSLEGKHDSSSKAMNQLTVVSALVLWVLVMSVEATLAQGFTDQPVIVAGDAGACELNAANLDNLIVTARESKERVFVISRLGKGETSRYLTHRRLHNARTYLAARLKPEMIILAEGERTEAQGRVEFYLGNKFIINALVARGGDLCVNCCEGLGHYYGWGKKDTRRRQRQLQYTTLQPNPMKRTR